MKRKSKLFLSLASMMFAVALLCFGVYSAISVNYTLSGSVSYQVTDAFVEITTKVYASKDLMDEETLKTSAQAIEESAFDSIQTIYGAPVKEIPTFNSLTGGDTFTPQVEHEIDIDYNQAYTYFIVINVKNLSSDVNVYAQITNKTDEQSLNSNIYTTKVQEQIIKPQESENNGKNIIIAYSLKDPTQSISQTFSYTITVNSGEYIPVGPTLQFVSSENTTITEGEQQNFIVEDEQATLPLTANCNIVDSEMGMYMKNITLENYQEYKGMIFSINQDSGIIGMYVLKRNYTFDEVKSLLTGAPPEEIMLAELGNFNGVYSSSCEITDKICIVASQPNIDLDITLLNEFYPYLDFTPIENGTAYSVKARNSSITGVDGKIEIPSEYMGIPVTTIKDSAFSGCSSLQNVDLSDCTNLTTIGDSAFRECINLTEITIPQGVTSIGSDAFWGCSSLTEITIPQNVETIGDSAFRGCSRLQSVNLSNCTNLTTIGDNAFYYCSNLQSVDLSDCTNLTTIGSDAFRDCISLTKITIPQSVTTIGDRAFQDCSRLQSVNLSGCTNLTTIGERVFSGCSLREITIPQSVETIGNNAFWGCQFTKVTYEKEGSGYAFKDGVLTINAMQDEPAWYTDNINPLITEVVWNCSPTSIGSDAFWGCSSLTEITIPQSVTTIGDHAFHGCSSLQSVDLNGCTNLTTMGNYAFNGCSSLSEITIPQKVTTIGHVAFDYCDSLVEVYNKSSLNITTTSYGLTALNVYKNESESKLKRYNQQGNESEDGNYIFYIDGDTKYFVKYKGQDTEITLPTISSIDSYEIYEYAFNDNKKITSVIIPDSVTTIGDRAFAICMSLNTVTIDNLDIANAITSKLSQGALLNFLQSGTGVVKVKCSGLDKVKSTYLTNTSNFTATYQDGYAVFTKK